ncbi:unnamed protein product [Phaedon cochleariae]|uniref:SIAH-type domain-containing protein n=1 Tax=Phaedon cochleariae TaxID=80249 RepID=A0A9P0DR96_PHACE|nr:unnamed protein product [Phaedon cochleariae]
MELTTSKLVPDEVLEASSCHLCYKYLTVTPIQSIDGCTICGRCNPKTAIKAILQFHGSFSSDQPLKDLPVSLLGYMTNPKSLYPCVNRLDGCGELLKLTDIEKHEEYCLYEDTSCPKCSFKGVGSQLWQHFKRHHQKSLLCSSTPFYVDLSQSFQEVYLFRKGDFVCWLKMFYQEEFSQCLFQTTCVTRGTRRSKIKLSLNMDGFADVYEYVVLSNQLEMRDKRDYVINLKIDDIHLKETPFIVCKYDVVSLD